MKTIIQKDSLYTVNGDLFNNLEDSINAGNNGTSIIVPHVCNNINVFGAGFAGAVANHYPIVKENYHLLGSTFLKNNLGYVQFVEVKKVMPFNHKLIFANMIAQNHTISKNNPRPLNYLALTKCMVGVRNYISSYMKDQPIQIKCPKFGCGLAGGNWFFIQDLIKDIWSDCDIIVYSK